MLRVSGAQLFSTPWQLVTWMLSSMEAEAWPLTQPPYMYIYIYSAFDVGWVDYQPPRTKGPTRETYLAQILPGGAWFGILVEEALFNTFATQVISPNKSRCDPTLHLLAIDSLFFTIITKLSAITFFLQEIQGLPASGNRPWRPCETPAAGAQQMWGYLPPWPVCSRERES